MHGCGMATRGWAPFRYRGTSCLGKREVVSSLLRKEIILSVNHHPGKLTAEFVVRLEVTHEAKDNNKKT